MNAAPPSRNGDIPRAGADSPIRLLVFSGLYPNAAQPRHGVFVEERLRHLLASGRVSATVVAPVPWFPFTSARFGRYAAFARVPAREERHGVMVLHPRYPVVPKVGMNLAPALMYRALLPAVRRLVRDAGGFDLIDAHYFYPDGVVAVRMGAALGLPVVVTARGSDVTLLPKHPLPRRQILAAAPRAAALVAVSQALKERMAEVGIGPDRVTVLRNGVDLEKFRPLPDRAALRTGLCTQDGPVWIAVGRLVELKGVHITINALAKAEGVTLLVAGDGPERDRLQHLAQQLGVADRVRFLGEVAHDALCEHYNAADAMVLASSREGMANVILESLACGTPVIATAVEGSPELITCSAAGQLMEARTPEALLAAWQALRTTAPTRAATRAHAEGLGWKPIVDAQCALYARVRAHHANAVAA